MIETIDLLFANFKKSPTTSVNQPWGSGKLFKSRWLIESNGQKWSSIPPFGKYLSNKLSTIYKELPFEQKKLVDLGSLANWDIILLNYKILYLSNEEFKTYFNIIKKSISVLDENNLICKLEFDSDDDNLKELFKDKQVDSTLEVEKKVNKHKDIGNQYYTKKDYPEAVESYELALENHHCFIYAGDFDNAIKDFKYIFDNTTNSKPMVNEYVFYLLGYALHTKNKNPRDEPTLIPENYNDLRKYLQRYVDLAPVDGLNVSEAYTYMSSSFDSVNAIKDLQKSRDAEKLQLSIFNNNEERCEIVSDMFKTFDQLLNIINK
ncbi:hypothetical protein ACTFIY_001715 [Dictyostelium cf. discoideum]